MAKNKKKKTSKKEVEKQYGNGIAPISLNSNFNINTPTVETKKTTKETKKETKKKKKEKESIKVSDLVKSVDPDTPIAQKYNTEEYNQYYNSLSNKQKAKENEKVAKKISKQYNKELNQTRSEIVKAEAPIRAGILNDQFQAFSNRDNSLQNFENLANRNKTGLKSNETNPYSKDYNKTKIENAVSQETREKKTKLDNDVILADYLKNYYEQDNQEPTIAEKILSPVTQAGTLVTGIAKPLGYQQYQRKDGLKTYLPDKLDLNFQKTGEKIDNKVGKFIYEAGGEASKILASSGINAVAPGVGTGMYWTSMAGNNIAQARNKATEKGEKGTGKVLLNAAAKTALEYITGKFIGSATKGLTGGKASELEKAIVDKVYDSKFLQSLSDSTKLKIAKLVGTGVSEGTEEAIQDPIEKLIDILTFGDDGKHKNVKELVTDLETYKDSLKAFGAGALTSWMVEGANMAVSPSYYEQGAAEIEKNKRTKNEQKVIDAELQSRIATEFNGEATAKEIAQLQKEIIEDMDKGYVSTDTIEQTLGGKTYKELAKINQKKNNIQQEINELQKKADNNELSSLEEKQKLNDLKEEIKTIDDSEIRKQLNQEIQETIKNDVSLQESYREVGRRTENYKKDLSTVTDEKQRAVYQKAMDSGVLNNSNKTHALVDMIAKISSEKGINFDFTNNEQLEKSGFGVNGRNINGYVTDSGITINLNSGKAINRIVGHELTHTFEGTTLYTELQDNLKDFLGSEWDNQVAKYKELYKGVKNANIENELTSDLIGDYLFTDENYVRNLSTKNKNLFEKIYDEIKYLYNVATAGSKEKRQLEKVKRTFDRIYNETESKVTTEDAKYSISEDSQGRELTKNQKEYFKNSKNVDENGNLKVMYNGGGDYTTFDNTKMSDQSKWGKGIYLTEDPDIANMYGDNVKEVYVDIENPINQTEKTISFDKYNKLMQELYDEEADRYDYDMYGNDLELLWDATNKGSWADYGEQLRNIVGVDGLIIEDSNPAERMVIAFNSNQIKNVSNENPTSNADIRYDLSVKDAGTTQDNNGRRLSKDQLSYFKDSKAVDNDGNLITVYHTTTGNVAQFNEFNPVGTPYYRFGDQVVNYYTNSKEMSGSYADQEYKMADTSKITDKKGVNDILVEINNKLNGDRIFVIETNDNGTYFLYDKLHKNNHLMTKLYKSQEELFKNIKQDLQERAGFREKTQYEGYVNITNPYVIDAEERNWNQVVSQSNEFIDELDERVPQDIKDNLTRLYRESENKSAELRDEFNILENAIRGMWNSAVDEDIKKVSEVVKKVGYNEIEDALNYDGKMGIMGVNGWYKLAEVLEEQGIVGNSTAKLIIDDFKMPDSVKEYIQENYNKEIPIQMLWMSDTSNASKMMNQLGKTTTLQDLYNKNQEKYLEFDKYRYPQSYFMEQIAGEGNDYLGNDLEDMFETRAEIYSPEQVGEEIAQAASVGFSKPEMIRLWGTSKTTNDIVKEVIASNKDGSTNYDGVIIRNVYDYGGKSEGAKTFNDLYVTFNSNQFKAADNTNPTVDPDIRYSLSQDSQGRELSKEQQEYFKDEAPEVLDRNGNLQVLYHGTPNDFTVFDTNKSGDNGTWYGAGIYLTSNENYAQDFSGNNGKVMEVYAHITNPYIPTIDTINADGTVSFAPTFIEDFENRFKDKLPENWEYLRGKYRGEEISNILKNNGYDGIIVGDNYVVFESNQVKNVDNLNPTSNDDIRYSLDIAPISKNFLTEAEQDELDGLRAVENSGFSELTPEEQSRMYELENRANTILNKKAEKMLRSASYKAINTTTKIAQNYLDFDAKQKKEFRSQMREFSNMTKDELVNADTYNKVKDIVSQYANKEYTYFDDSVESLKRELKHTKIQISDELKNQITDYGDFVKDSKLMLRRNSGQSVDKVYQEYSNMYPGFFDDSIMSEADQLEALNDFVNHDFSVTEKYKLTDEDLRNATDLIYNKLLDNSLTQQDLIETEEILDKKAQKRTRSVVREELLQKMGITPETIQVGNDISAISFARTDPIRVNEKVFGWETGQKINDATVNFTKHQEAERIRFLNKERQEIKDLGIKARSKESELVQKYGEKQYIDKNNEVHKYGDAELERDVQDAATREKIKNAARVLRQKYDTYIDRVNEVLTEMGYDEIPKRKDYMRHFVELDDKFSRWGLPFNKESMSAEDLPTDINGLTEFNRPGKSYFASANTRTGLQTTYDAITGIDGYLEGVSNLIYHTESIQRYRALTRLIRENFGREHGYDNMDLMTDEELADRIKDIQDNKLSKYVAWLDEQANSIAGKKGALDRSVERMFGRRIYTALNTLKSQVGSNMTGFNVRSAMTNFASAIQGMSKTQKLAFAKGTISTINNIIHNDGMIDKSDFLTRRFGSDSLALKPWQKLSKAGQVFMEGTDYFTANQIWRSKYFENLQKGMSEEQAIKNADDFAARIMGDRSKGSTAELFNSKTLGFLSQFQLEVNNQWSSLIHDNKIDIQKGNKTALGVTFELGQLFAASYMFNTMMKALTGSDVMIDPIDMMKKIFFPDDDDKDKTIVQRAQEVLGEFINQLPFANLVTGGGRIPISEAFTGAQTLGKKLMGGTDNYGNEITWGDVKDDALESAAYWVLPTGYGQIRKTTKGLSMYDDKLPIAGSYTDSGNLRFSAEDTTLGKIKAGLFGQYSSKYAQDYIKSGYKSINASKLDEMKDLDMNSTEYRKYRQGLSEAGTSVEDKLNYINSLDVPYADKDIMASNVAKKDIDMKEYNKYGSYEEFNYAQQNPVKYKMMQYLGGYDTYKNYEKEINGIKADYDRNGKAITNSRKNKVIKYVNSLNLSAAQKAMFIKQEYPSFTKYDNQIASYINRQDISYMDKASILKQLGFTAYDRQIINYIKQNYRTVEEQQRELEKLGFKVYNYNGKTYVR